MTTKLAAHTLWVTPCAEGFELVTEYGNVLYTNKYQSHCRNYGMRLAATPEAGVWAIAVVTMPYKRQPNRALPRSKRK